MLRHLVREFRQVRFAIERYYRRRARKKLTPEEDAAYLVRRMHREQEMARRNGWRR